MWGSVAATGVRLDVAELPLNPLRLGSTLSHVGEVAFAGSLLLMMLGAQGLEVLETVVVASLTVVYV